MRIRRHQSPRGSTLYLIRSVYDKDRKGMREIYLGSISAWAYPDSLPEAVKLSHDRTLTDAELAQLRAYLEPNRPQPLELTRALCRRIEAVTAEILEHAERLRSTGTEYPRREMRSELKALGDAWSKHLKALRYAGLRGSWPRRRGEPDPDSGGGNLF